MYTIATFDLADLKRFGHAPFFEKHVRQFDADKHAKGFKTWDQLIALMYAQKILWGAPASEEVEQALIQSGSCIIDQPWKPALSGVATLGRCNHKASSWPV